MNLIANNKMRKPITPLAPLKAAVVFFISALAATSGFAQTSNSAAAEQEEWHQVEIIVFANTNELAASNEIWQTPQGLNYPSDSLYLQSSGTTDTENTIPPAPAANSNFSFNNNNIFPINQQPSFLQSTAPADDREQPYTLLTDDQLTLKTAVRRLNAQRDFRTLFHAAWRQPIASRAAAKSIIINAGESFDNHYELEGTIKVGLERYLHIETDLWLSSFVSNIGLTDNPWPVLPKRPSNPIETAQNTLSNQLPASMESSLLQLFGNQFSVERTLVLRQQRRMRSDELHYIDHPLMGVLVRVSTYERPEPEEEEEEEIEANPESPSTESPATENAEAAPSTAPITIN